MRGRRYIVRTVLSVRPHRRSDLRKRPPVPSAKSQDVLELAPPGRPSPGNGFLGGFLGARRGFLGAPQLQRQLFRRRGACLKGQHADLGARAAG
jgi:hypothetical protein